MKLPPSWFEGVYSGHIQYLCPILGPQVVIIGKVVFADLFARAVYDDCATAAQQLPEAAGAHFDIAGRVAALQGQQAE